MPNCGLEPVGRRALRAGHDAGVGDEHVEAVVVGEHAVGERPHRRQVGEVERAQLVRRRVDAGIGRGAALALVEVADAEDQRGAVGGEGPRGLDPEPGRCTGDERRSCR